MKVLFACIHNSGRSVAAEVLLRHHSSFEVFSAGSAPSTSVNPAVAAVLAERGLSAVGHAPTLLTPALVGDVDVVITMGCGETCPVVPGKRYEDWPVADPKDQPLEVVRAIVDDIESRVLRLLTDLDVAPDRQ